MRRAFALLFAVLVVASPARALASTADSTDSGADAATTTTIDNSFLDTKRDLTDCLGNSVDLPDCGREPTSSGDRGGAAQLATFGVMTLGIAFIAWRVTRSVRARDAATRPGHS